MTTLPSYETVREEPATRTEFAWALLKDNIWKLVAAICFVLMAAVLIVGSATIPRWARLAGLTALGASFVGLYSWEELRKMLPDPPLVVLVDVDAREMDGGVFVIPVDVFNHELTVLDGDLNQVAHHLYFGKKVDLDAMEATGTWRGTMNDRQLVRGLQKVYECRGQLEEDAKKGFVLETQSWTIIRSGVRDAVSVVVDTFKKGTLPDDGEGVDNAVEEALEQFELDKVVDDLEDDDLDLSEELLDPDGDRDLDEQAEDRVGSRVDSDRAERQAHQEVSADDD